LAETSGLLGAADAQQASYMLKPFEALRDAYLKRATGEIGDEELKRQNTRSVELQRAFILADPDLARAAAASAIFGDSTVIQMFTQGNTVTNTKLMEMLRGGSAADPAHGASTPFVGIPEERKAVQGYLQGVTNSLNSADPEVKEEAKTQMTSLIASLEDYEGLIRSDPKKAIEVVNWLGSASFLAARNANPELFEDLSGPTDVLTRHYADEVWGLVQREFTNGKVLINTDINAPITGDMIASGQLSTDTSSLVQTRTTAGGVEFVAIDTENPDAVNAARRLNKELRPVINNTVKAFAHLEGRTDYGAVWDEVATDVLGAGAGATTSGGDETDDLSMDDFMMPHVSGAALPADVASDTEFVSRVNDLATRLEIDPKVVMAVMDFETGGSFNPAQKNAAGSSATGLIQFMASTAKDLGTTTEELAGMSRTEQMKYVDKYFDQHADAIRGGDARDVYMAVLFPKAIGKSEDYVLFREGTTAYTQNKGLDRNGDGTVTKAEAARKVVSLVGKYADS